MTTHKELADKLDRSTRYDEDLYDVMAKAIAILRGLDAQPVAWMCDGTKAITADDSLVSQVTLFARFIAAAHDIKEYE